MYWLLWAVIIDKCSMRTVSGQHFVVLRSKQKLSRGPMMPARGPFYQIEKVRVLVLRDTYD